MPSIYLWFYYSSISIEFLPESSNIVSKSLIAFNWLWSLSFLPLWTLYEDFSPSYFSKRYGSLSVYLEMDDQLYPKGFNPLSDKYVSVKIAKEGKLYIADFINPNQIIEELLDGIVSFLVMKVNGQVAIIMGSLKEGIVNGEEHVRQAGFSPLGDGRILLWSTVKQKWSSFYPDNLLSMTRDDTDDLE